MSVNHTRGSFVPDPNEIPPPPPKANLAEYLPPNRLALFDDGFAPLNFEFRQIPHGMPPCPGLFLYRLPTPEGREVIFLVESMELDGTIVFESIWSSKPFCVITGEDWTHPGGKLWQLLIWEARGGK